MSHIRNQVSTFIGDLVRPLIVLLVVSGLALFTTNLISGQLFSATRINNQGAVKIVDAGVYWDVNCTRLVQFIDWGKLEPASAKNVSVYIRNEGNEPATLFLTTENWNPPNASNFITLSWDYDGQMLSPFLVVQLTLTLSVSSAIEEIENFNFDIIISASG